MSKKYISVPVQYNISEDLKSDDIKIPVEILVMHNNVNLNNSNFDLDVIESAKESIKNIPILGYVKKIDGSDSKDFAGHEIEIVFGNDGIKVVYIQRPIGIIPETNNYEYVEKDGKTYVKVIGYLWKEYLNDGYEILQESPNKSVSMEIVIDAYEIRNDDITDIKNYRYTGITVLGDSYQPAMAGANMQVIDTFSNQKFSKEFYEKVEQLNSELKYSQSYQREEDNTVNEELNNVVETEEVLDENTEAIQTEESTDVSDIETNEQPEVIETENISDSSDVSFESKEELNDKESLLESRIKEYELNIAQLKSENEELKNQVSSYEETIKENENLISELQKYQENNELSLKQSEVDSVIEEFENVLKDVEDFENIKSEAINYEIDNLKEKLSAMAWKVTHKSNSDKSKKSNFSRAIVTPVSNNDDKTSEIIEKYGSAAKYFKNKN